MNQSGIEEEEEVVGGVRDKEGMSETRVSNEEITDKALLVTNYNMKALKCNIKHLLARAD